ncbi:hypothetical protein F5Y19DRAFT_490734 [Xylariaceae sp. FL1651]|nr:hypothetical protein F5Y19DRAFT_490734 [Xylariaceae sp. FL1651]
MQDERYRRLSIDSLEHEPDEYYGVIGQQHPHPVENSSTDASIYTPSIGLEQYNPYQGSNSTYELTSTTKHPDVNITAQPAQERHQAASHSHNRFSGRWRRIWFYGWVAETMGCLLSIIAFLAIFATLRIHEDKPLPKWPFSISINALIAVFGVLFKAGLTMPLSEGISQLKWQWFEKKRRELNDLQEFDSASRGAWGAFLFLFMGSGESPAQPARWWQWPESIGKFFIDGFAINIPSHLAKYAALLTVLSLLVDPILQQIVVYVNCGQISEIETASVARTNNYYNQGGHIGPLESDIDSSMAVAINTGMVNPPAYIPSLISTTCKSGNCTFDNFASVGLCSACEDLSNQTRPAKSSDGSVNFTLPGNLDEDGYGFPAMYLYHQYAFRTAAAYSLLPRLLDFRVMSLPKTTSSDTHASAFHCSIDPCVHGYHSQTDNNNLTQSVVSSTRMGYNYNIIDDQSVHYNDTKYPGLACEKEGPGLVKVGKENVDAAPLDGVSDKNGNGISKDPVWYPEECVFSFGQGAVDAIGTTVGSALDDLEMQRTGGVEVGSIIAKNIWRNGTVDLAHMQDFTQKLADVMTATIRNNGGDKYASGEVLINDTCIHVQWAWLAYPAVLLGLSILFLMLMIFQAPTGSSGRVWKSSILAPLFISMDETMYDTNHYDMSKHDMNQFAKLIRAQLVRDAEGKAKFL